MLARKSENHRNMVAYISISQMLEKNEKYWKNQGTLSVQKVETMKMEVSVCLSRQLFGADWFFE